MIATNTHPETLVDQKTLSDAIRNCRTGVVANPFQGNDRKVVFVCSMGILRSATGARLYANKYNTRSVGTWPDCLIPLTQVLVNWADEIVFVNESNYKQAVKKFDLDAAASIRVLNIPDNYEHMHPELIKAFKEQYEPI
jgi:predicted protein tyrosine phosphatase